MPEPYELSKAMAPHSGLLGASLGAGIGGLSGLLSDPGYDEETGDRKSRFRAVLKGLTGGGLIGGAAGAAAPFAAEGYGRNLAGPVQSLLDGGEDKEAKAAVIYSLEKVSSYRKNQSAARVKMASAVLHLDAINRELDSYNLYDLRKSAAIGVRRVERMKVAALIRQRELEKRAFSKAIMGRGGKGGKGGLVGTIGKGLGGLKDYAFGVPAAARGAAQGAGGAARQARSVGEGVGQQARQVLMPGKQLKQNKAAVNMGRNLARDYSPNTPQNAARWANQSGKALQQVPTTAGGVRREALGRMGQTMGEMGRGAMAGARQGFEHKLPKPGFSPGLGGPGGAAATGLGTLAALTQLPGHGSGQGAGGAAAGVPQRISGMMQNLPRPGFSPGLGGPAGSPPTAAPQRQGLYDNPNSVPSKKTDAMMTSMIRNWPKDQAARQVASDGPAAPPMPTGPARPVPAPPLETPPGDPGMTGPGGYPLRLPGRPDQPPKPTAY